MAVQNTVEFRDLPAVAMGLTQAEGQEYEVLKVYQPRRLYKKLVLRGDALVGFILVGDIAQAGVYGALLKKQAPVRRIKDRLLRPDFTYALLWPRQSA